MNFITEIQLFAVQVVVFTFTDFSWAQPNTIKMDIRAGEAQDNALLTRIFYSSDSFSDIPAIISKRESERGVKYNILCARGVWLLYDKTHLTASNLSGVSLYASKEFKCTPLEDLDPLGSAQPVTVTEYEKPQITFFPATNFMGIGMRVADKIKDEGTYPTSTSIINSLITVGQRRWTVILSDGTRLCIQPKKSDNAICFLSNLVDNEKIFPSSGVRKVRRHCKIDDPGLIVELSECYEQGAGLVRFINPAWPFGLQEGENPDTEPTKKPPTDCTLDSNKDVLTDEQKRLLEARINGTLGTGDWMEAVKSRDNIWKTEIFEKTLKLFLMICDQRVIEPEYMLLFAHLYFNYWDKALAKDDAPEIEFPEDEWMEINHDIDYCYETLANTPEQSVSKFVSDAFKSYRKLSDITNKIDAVLGVRPEYDHIMEINWIMANTVASTCYDALKNNINFVTKFWNIYHPLYFTPIEDNWTDGSSETLVYKYIFGGFGMEKSLAKIGFCGLATMVEAHLLKPYPRPMEQIKRVFIPK